MVSVTHLKKGDLLLKEGNRSSAMYWVQSGSLRLFKKKGAGFIELGLIRKGKLVGEMSFLDDEPHSASVEAINECDVVEIPRGKFDELMEAQPTWLSSLLQTIVKRLRAADNRLQEIEDASTVYVTNQDGGTSKQHEFLSTNDVLRLSMSLICACMRKGEQKDDGSCEVDIDWMHMYGGNISQIAAAKLTTYLDVMEEAGVLRTEKNNGKTSIFVASIEFLERFLFWVHEENLKPDDKRLVLSQNALVICDMIYQYGDLASFDSETVVSFNMEELYKKSADATASSHPFDLGCFDELVNAGMASEIKVASNDEKFTELNLELFKKLYPFLNLRQRFIDLNEIKRSQAK